MKLPGVCGRSGRRGKKKCSRPGPVVRNGFFNFLRDFRKKTCGLSAVQIAKRGGAIWRRMSEKEKCKYLAMAAKAPPYRRKMKRRMKKRSRRSGRRC